MSGSNVLAANQDRRLFSVGPRSFTVRDVIDAAAFRGELLLLWITFLRAVASEQRALAEERSSDDEAIGSAAQTFRYDHDLITAEETERWLADRGLTLDDFSAYFIRSYWANTLPTGKVDASADTAVAAEMRELFVAELTFSGELDHMAKQLSWRVAAAAAQESAPGAENVAAERVRFENTLKPIELSAWLTGADRDEQWLKRMAELEANYRERSARVLTPQARQRELGTLRLQLTVFDVEVIELDSADAACEALLCVRDDGMEMEAVAAEGRFPFRREQLLLEDIAPEVQQQFLSAHSGELLEPIEAAGAHRLYRIIGKSEPDSNSADVQRRIEQRLLARHFAELVSQHVRWELQPS